MKVRIRIRFRIKIKQQNRVLWSLKSLIFDLARSIKAEIQRVRKIRGGDIRS